MSYFLIGLDLAQSADYTATSVLERTADANQTDIRLDLRYLDRYQGRSYTAVATDIRDLVTRLKERHPGEEVAVIFDRTGVGAAVGDVMRDAGIDAPLVPVMIHGGNDATYDAGIWKVPKRDLVSALIVPFQNHTLKIAPELPLAPVLTEELATFKLKFNAQTAHDSYSAWREGQHDDLVLSVSLAAWWGSRILTGPCVWFAGGDDDDW